MTSSSSTDLRTTLAKGIRLGLVVLVTATMSWDIASAGDSFQPEYYFTFFTILSNLLAGIVAGLGLVFRVPPVVRGMALTALLLTFLVVLTLLGGINVVRDPWTVTVMHGVTPLLALADWLVCPPRKKLPAQSIWWWVLAPLAYLAFALIQGRSTGWYPYPFLNVAELGIWSVLLTCVIISAIYIAISFGLRWVANRLVRSATH